MSVTDVPKKVWVVTRFANQSDRCFGVFTSEKKALAYIRKTALEHHRDSIKQGYATSNEKRMKPETVEDRYWEGLHLDLSEEEVDPVD